MIVIVDYGMGNLGSVLKSFKRLQVEAKLSESIHDIESADKLVLPGVGHFANGMLKLKEYKYLEILDRKVIQDKVPILGICLGMQLFAGFSEEGGIKGLGWLDADVVRFKIDDTMKWKVPHMGWNSIRIEKERALLSGIEKDELFYFAHSYHMKCNDEMDILTSTDYSYRFSSAVQKENIFGVQFHPEKSHNWGLQLIKNFVEI
jgi:imidazole glycerol-phosphate synthase subunit HisH